jgi:2-polyprenyl-3-methyl-5-hydroxy-6-metoxy-1,4-benzoquinol methylase
VKLPHILNLSLAGVCLVGLSLTGCTQSPTNETEQPDRSKPTDRAVAQTAPTEGTSTPSSAQPVQKDVPYVPTPTPVVNEMLRLANVKKNDVLYDLGSGDGRIVITAAQKFGTRGIGIDIDPQRIQEANQNAQTAGVTNLVQFRQQDLFETDFSKATVVTLYLLPDINLKLKPRLLSQLKPGTRVVSHAFDMGDWKPQKVVTVAGQTIYYWTVPQKTTKKS